MASRIIFVLHLRPPPPPAAPFLSSRRSIVASRVHGVLPRRGANPCPVSSPSSSSSSSSLRPLLHLPGKERRRAPLTCFYNAKGENLEPEPTENGPDADCPVLRRWDVPWDWPTVSLTMLACAVSFVLTGLVGSSVLPYLGLQGGGATLDEIAEVLFAGQFSVTAVVLGVIFGITNTFQPFSDDIFRYDLKEPFKLQDGWLLWAVIGLVGALIAISLVGVVLNSLNGGSPQRETDALIRLLPLIGSSSISTACLVGITGVLAPVLEETVFRGFLLVSLTKWFPTPVSILISAAIFAVAHLTPGEFPQLFVLGTALGFTYAQTRNLLTPITTHALWNSGVILLLTFLQLQGYDIKELLQAS